MVDIIIDIETLGTRPGCPIIEIGACAINSSTGEIYANFSRRVNGGWTYVELVNGLVNSDDITSTVNWWISDSVRERTFHALLSGYGSAAAPETALRAFSDWVADVTAGADKKDGVRLWANGPAFDTAILRFAYDLYGMRLPWLCYSERCVRTALEMANYERGSVGWIERGPRHRALNDARHEARKLFYSGALGDVSAIMRRLRQRYDKTARQS